MIIIVTLQILVMFFRQKYEEYCTVTFIEKVKLGGLVVRDKKSQHHF